MRITWERLIYLEPELEWLKKQALNQDSTKDDYDKDHIWYRIFKRRLLQLVGFMRDSLTVIPELETSQAYEVAYHKIYNSLPEKRRQKRSK